MSRATVRSSVQSYFSQTPGFERVSMDAPWLLMSSEMGGDGEGAVGFIHISNQSETRATVGVGGSKVVTYQVGFSVQYRYPIPPDDTTRDMYAIAHDTLLQAVIDRLRADPTLGTGPDGVVWDAGGEDGDITVATDLPVEDRGLLLIWCVIDFRIREVVQT